MNMYVKLGRGSSNRLATSSVCALTTFMRVTSAGSAVLSLGGAKLYATVIEPPGGVFSAAAVDLLPPQKPSSGVSKLEIHLNLNLDAAAAASAAAADDDAVLAIATPPVARIVVGLSLSAAATAVTPNPLAQWKADGPFAAGDWN